MGIRIKSAVFGLLFDMASTCLLYISGYKSIDVPARQQEFLTIEQYFAIWCLINVIEG